MVRGTASTKREKAWLRPSWTADLEAASGFCAAPTPRAPARLNAIFQKSGKFYAISKRFTWTILECTPVMSDFWISFTFC
jgi:hypothetical protein